MDAIEVVKNLLMKAGEFFIQVDGAIAIGLGAFFFVGTAGTVLALVNFFCPAITVSLNRPGTQEMKFFVIGADETAVLIA